MIEGLDSRCSSWTSQQLSIPLTTVPFWNICLIWRYRELTWMVLFLQGPDGGTGGLLLHTGYDVPQRSVLFPMLLNIHMNLLAEIIRRFGLQYHQDVENSALLSDSQEQMAWMRGNKLRLSSDKTGVLVLGPNSVSGVGISSGLYGVVLSLKVSLLFEGSSWASPATEFPGGTPLPSLLNRKDLAMGTHGLVTSKFVYGNAIYMVLPLKTR